MVRHRQVHRIEFPQEIPHRLSAVGVQQARTIPQRSHGAYPVQKGIQLVALLRLCGKGSPAEFLDPSGETEVVGEQGAGVPGSEDEASSVFGDSPDALTGFSEPRSGAHRVYAPPATGLLFVRGMTGVVG